MEHDLDELDAVIFTDASEIVEPVNTRCRVYDWSKLTTPGSGNMPESSPSRSISDPAVIFYTSGSTGRAKGVIISHENLVDGARIVSGYLENTRCDRLVAGLPLGFDYGFSQATTALYVGAELILTNYSLPQTLLAELIQSRATCLAGVPAMWAQLVNVQWPKEFAANLRYITNSGGRLPQSVLSALRARLPDTRIFLMYGLTEAFRSSFLDPALVDEYPDSIGRPVPGVQLHVVRPDGTLCAPDEPGELVHSGALVALGYWNDPEATAEKFRPLPASSGTDLQPELAVWTGDIAKQDRNGLLFFLERADSMLKCSGYRISPTEIEETIYESGLVKHVVAVGIPDEINGQRIGLAVVPKSAHDDTDFALRYVCARELPPYMQPAEIRVLDHLPVNANGKPNRASIEALFD
jgi:acyl-CoA synthetase (AMP-forming)/AMP-acid ligase II